MSAILGIDEVGRGCWAGPLVAGAVVLAGDIPGLADSKKLTKKRREILAKLIHEQAAGVGIGWVTAREVDQIGLTKAVQLAMLRAVKEVHANGATYSEIIIDGNYNFFQNVQGLQTTDISTLVRADDSIPAVSAASIVAKVARDTFMTECAQKFPAYGFESNVGYGAPAHIAALKTHGICELHRKSYKPIQALVS
jgi:ribonuclease HII